MGKITEPLDQGLFNAEDPAFLKPGQLSGLQNLVYNANQQALVRATGRSQFAAVSANGVSATAVNVDGLRNALFDTGDNFLVAMTPSAYSTATVGDTGTFGLATAITGGNYLERVHYRNRYYLLNGVAVTGDTINTNLAMYVTGSGVGGQVPTFRQHGMLPVNSAPVTAAVTGPFSQSVIGYYDYWTTEVAKLTQDSSQLVIESAFNSESGPTVAFVTSTGMYVTIQMPPIRNSITNFWRVYRSPKKEKQNDKIFPLGFMIAEQSVSTATASGANTISDTSTVASAGSFPSTVNTVSPYANWASASAATAAGAARASATVPGTSIMKDQGFYGFNFGGFTGPVKGIAVEFAAYISSGVSGNVPFEVRIGERQGDGRFTNVNISPPGLPSIFREQYASKAVGITATGTGTLQVATVGSSADIWFAPNSPYRMTDSSMGTNFMVTLGISRPNTSVGVDYVRATAYYGGTTDSTVQYPAIVYTFGDISSEVSKNHPPPSASTGDLFEDMLVVNDATNPSLIRYSFSGEPEYFPPTYFVDFETADNDRVSNIKVVNNVLIVGMAASVWRVNSLPTERDASFDRGRAIEVISPNYGVVNEMCACTFTIPGVGTKLAFVSNNGIHATDGFGFETYSDGLDWGTIRSTSSTYAPIALINDPDAQELLFYYRNDSFSNDTFKCLHLLYNKDQLVDGKPKVSGPVNMRNYNAAATAFASLESAWPVTRASGQTNVYLGYGGTATAAGGGYVYRENGTTIPAFDDRAAYVTRRFYGSDMSGEWMLGDLYGYTPSYSGTPQITYTVEKTKTNDSGPVTSGSKSITLGGQKLHKVTFAEGGEGMRVSAVITASAYVQSNLILMGEDLGGEDAGR